MTKASFTSQSKRASDLLELIHFGLISYVVKGKKKWFFSISLFLLMILVVCVCTLIWFYRQNEPS
jgi:hypothetical protein